MPAGKAGMSTSESDARRLRENAMTTPAPPAQPAMHIVHPRKACRSTLIARRTSFGPPGDPTVVDPSAVEFERIFSMTSPAGTAMNRIDFTGVHLAYRAVVRFLSAMLAQTASS